MPRYIDADEALRQLENNRKDNPCQAPYRGIWDMASKNAIDTIEAIPTANVIEVVRCKECKWFLPHKYIEGYDGNCDLSGCEVCNDDYCSRADMRGRENEKQ